MDRGCSLDNSLNHTQIYPALNVAARQEVREEGGDGGWECLLRYFSTSWHPKGNSTFPSCYSQLFSCRQGKAGPVPTLDRRVQTPFDTGIICIAFLLFLRFRVTRIIVLYFDSTQVLRGELPYNDPS